MKDIVAEFGDDILSSDATIDRKKLGAIVFSDRNAMSVSLWYLVTIRVHYILHFLSQIIANDSIFFSIETGANRMASCAHKNRGENK